MSDAAAKHAARGPHAHEPADPTAGDSVDHLVDAARELIGAARSVLDAIEAVIDDHADARARPARARVRRIDLD